MLIIGAGMSGLLAAHYFRHLSPQVLEQQPSLPNNHKALLRFRSESVSDLTGIPFKKVKVNKMVSFEGAQLSHTNLYLNNLYSQKVTGDIRSRSIGNLDDCQRFIAPEDFISKLSNGVNVKYGEEFDQDMIKDQPIISTIPVFTLASILEYDGLPKLKSKEIWVFSFEMDMDVDVYQTVYYPSPQQGYYRISITGKKFIAEFHKDPTEHTLDALFDHFVRILEVDFGIEYTGTSTEIDFSHQKYGKLIECDTSAVKDFIGWATHNHNVYSLGRWGTHRQLLMDDVVSDLKTVGNMIRTNRYSR
jgi:hypothetical protein